MLQFAKTSSAKKSNENKQRLLQRNKKEKVPPKLEFEETSAETTRGRPGREPGRWRGRPGLAGVP